jgi:hypothetical protein
VICHAVTPGSPWEDLFLMTALHLWWAAFKSWVVKGMVGIASHVFFTKLAELSFNFREGKLL